MSRTRTTARVVATAAVGIAAIACRGRPQAVTADSVASPPVTQVASAEPALQYDPAITVYKNPT